MEFFPSLIERTVASALLLLSTPPPSLSPTPRDSKLSAESEKSSLALSSSRRSCSSTVTNDDGSSAETPAHPLRMIAAVARCHETKLKVVRKSRSKICWRSDTRRPISIGKPTEMSSERASEATSSSCLSSSSSAVSTGRSRGRWKKERASLARNSKTELPAGVVRSAILRRRAEAIKRLLSNGCSPTSEMRIRLLLGDSPDTSKALRMLLKREEIKRSGAGGRTDPYLYMIA